MKSLARIQGIYITHKGEALMRWGRLVLGAAMDLVGLVWFLQGIRVLPGSFMTGSTFWAVVGLLVMIGGMAVLITAVRG